MLLDGSLPEFLEALEGEASVRAGVLSQNISIKVLLVNSLADGLIDFLELVEVNRVADHGVESVVDVFNGALQQLVQLTLLIKQFILLLSSCVGGSLQSNTISSGEEHILAWF